MASEKVVEFERPVQEPENMDLGIIDDCAIDREIASTYNLPTPGLASSTEPQALTASGYSRQIEDGDLGRLEYGYSHGLSPPARTGDHLENFGVDCRVDHREGRCGGCGGDCTEDCGGDYCGRGDYHEDYPETPAGPAYFARENLEISQSPIPYGEYSTDPTYTRNGSRVAIASSIRPNMDLYQPNRPMHQRSQPLGDYGHPAYDDDDFGHAESSEYLGYDFPSPPRDTRHTLRQAEEYEDFDEPDLLCSERPVGLAASGVRRERYSTNLIPPRVRTESVSNAALEKRGLARGKEDTIAIRGAGINDPENIRIVNLRDNEGQSWDEISDLLNKDRIARGAEPRFTPNNVHNRYNRNAPVLCAAEGVPFVPIRERKKRKIAQRQKSKASNWSNSLDELLVKTHMEVKGWFWEQVCTRFEEAGGFAITPTQAANRMKMI